MNPLIHLKKVIPSFVVPFVLTWFALSPQARAVCQQGCDSSLFSAFLGDDALINNTTGAGNTGLGCWGEQHHADQEHLRFHRLGSGRLHQLGQQDRHTILLAPLQGGDQTDGQGQRNAFLH